MLNEGDLYDFDYCKALNNYILVSTFVDHLCWFTRLSQEWSDAYKFLSYDFRWSVNGFVYQRIISDVKQQRFPNSFVHEHHQFGRSMNTT